MTPELSARIQLWRAKALDGTITQDELREAIMVIRQERLTAQTTSTKARSARKETATISSDQLLDELKKL